MILIYIFKLKKKYMRNKRLLYKNKNPKLDGKITINLKKLNIIKSKKCFKYWTVNMMDLYPKNVLISNIYLTEILPLGLDDSPTGSCTQSIDF